MKHDKTFHSGPVPHSKIREISCSLTSELNKELENSSSRTSFFQCLSKLLQRHLDFDRLCINLYDPNSELLSFFAAAEGTVVNALSPVRKAEKTTVAGHVIASCKPVIITDIAQHFAESQLHPMAEAGLTTTMAFPLLLNGNILGTLHCSFVKKPENLYNIMELFLELSSSVAICLGAVLAAEGLEQGLGLNPLQCSLQPVHYDDFIFISQTMRHFMKRVNIIAKLDVPVLLLGETGTGKTHLAQYIHYNSNRNSQHFVKVNCPALAPTLFESELFGHAKGAFTGASTKRLGRFEIAHQGTLFLDEIAELSGEMQSKLLHVLDDRRFERVGESVSLDVDTRIVAATNVPVRRAVNEGRLRSDFYHRLSVCILEMPPLRDRLEDIPVLVGFFINKLSAMYNLPRAKFSHPVISRLQSYTWPGNIRELRNVMSSLLLQNCVAGEITECDVDNALQNEMLEAGTLGAPVRTSFPQPGPEADSSLEEVERKHIETALERCGGVVSGPKGAATLLGLPRSTLQHRMRKLGVTSRKG